VSEYTHPLSPVGGFYARDDFLGNDSIADAAVGSLRWEFGNIAGAGAGTKLVTTNVGENEHGILRDTTAAGAGPDGEYYRFLEDTTVLGGNGGYFKFKARIPATLAGHHFQIGLTDTITAAEPTVGIWVDCDEGSIDLKAHSADHGDITVDCSNVGTFTTGCVMTLATWHVFDVRWNGLNDHGGPRYVQMWVDGYLAAQIHDCQIGSDEEMELKILHYADAAAALAIDIDFIELFLARDQ
jgi:hypothetical protein